MPKALERTNIADDTAILPHVVADGVISRLQVWVHDNADTLAERLPRGGDAGAHVEAFVEALSRGGRTMADAMSKRADAAYEASTDFARKVAAPGNKGRDFLYSFMQHWLCAEAKEMEDGRFEDVVDALPSGYASGDELPEAPSRSMGR